MNGHGTKRPLLLVMSAPSGAGKTTLCDRLLAEYHSMARSISCTTRAPRGAEKDGRDYYFISPVEFERRVAAGLFLEHAVVHGNRYGTLRSYVEDRLNAGKDVLLVIDVQGAAEVRQAARSLGGILGRAYVDVFISPPSISVLRERLQKRAEDSPTVIECRLKNAQAEMARANEYQHRVVNDDLDKAAKELHALVEAERHRAPC